MGFTYLKDKNWKDITREERLFCAELYFSIKRNEKKFIKWLNEKAKLNLSPNEIETEWEAGYEVCFYRDYIHEIKTSKDEYPSKRTFDLCLFSPKNIVIIEAKAQQGFNQKQLNKIKNDKQLLKKLLKEKCPKIYMIALYSSKYSPKQQTLDFFDGKFTWADLFKFFEQNPIFIFKRANDIYKDNYKK
jgi:hypothetical protein